MVRAGRTDEFARAHHLPPIDVDVMYISQIPDSLPRLATNQQKIAALADRDATSVLVESQKGGAVDGCGDQCLGRSETAELDQQFYFPETGDTEWIVVDTLVRTHGDGYAGGIEGCQIELRHILAL